MAYAIAAALLNAYQHAGSTGNEVILPTKTFKSSTITAKAAAQRYGGPKDSFGAYAPGQKECGINARIAFAELPVELVRVSG